MWFQLAITSLVYRNSNILIYASYHERIFHYAMLGPISSIQIVEPEEVHKSLDK